MARHIGDEDLQDHLEGVLRGDAREGVEAHMESCAGCAEKLSEWRTLFASLEALPPVEVRPDFRIRVLKALRDTPDPVDAALGSLAAFEPSADFSQRVMHEVRTGAPVRVRAPVREQRWQSAKVLDWLLPSSPGGWALAMGLAVTPALGILIILGALVAHPLLGPGEVMAFLGGQAASLVQSGLLRGIAMVSQSPAILPIEGLIRTLLDTPGAAVGAILGAWSTTAAAGWILYRNLFTDPPGSRPYVQAP